MTWDNLNDVELDAMPAWCLRWRVVLYTLIAIDRTKRPDYPDASRALDRAIAAVERRA